MYVLQKDRVVKWAGVHKFSKITSVMLSFHREASIIVCFFVDKRNIKSL